MTKPNTELDRYLDEVSAHLGRQKGRRDLLMELRTAILDRAEDLAGGAVDDDSIRRAVGAMGDPADVALAYAGERYLIAPRQYRAFMVYTGLLFAIHLVMILVATVTGSGIEIFPASVMRVAHPHSLVNLFFTAVQALLFDVGLMVVIFAGAARVHGAVRLPRLAFRAPLGVRPSIARALLAILVLVILNFLRERLFTVALHDRSWPLFTRSFVDVLPWINGLLGVAVAKELLYAWLDERRFIVAADALHAAAAAVVMVWFLGRPDFIAFPEDVSESLSTVITLNQLVAKTVDLILISFAAAFAWAFAKRVIRFFQL